MARKTGRPAITSHQVQADVEGAAVVPEVVGGAAKIEFMGNQYRMAESIGMMPMLKFAHVSSRGVDSNDLEGMAALYSMIRDCIDPDEWARFEQDAIDKKADGDDLLAVVSKVIETVSARPTRPPKGSPNGRRSTSANSKASSPLPAMRPGDEDLIPVGSLLDR